MKNNIFKAKLGKVNLKNCTIDDDKIVFANKGVEFLVIPIERFVYQHYKVIGTFTKTLGIEASYADPYDDSEIFRNVTLIYNDKYVCLKSLYDEGPEYSATNGSISQAELYNFVAYVLLNNKEVKFSK